MTVKNNDSTGDAAQTLLGTRYVLDDADEVFQVLADAMPQMVWSTTPDGKTDYFNARWYEYTGVPSRATDGMAWATAFHPDDQQRALERWQHSVDTGAYYEIEYRLRHRSGDYRWVIGRGSPVRNAEGAITRWIGTCTDIHDQKLQAGENELLLRELSHRIKNIFAVINGIIGLSARAQPEAADFARELKQRIASLGRAHDLARPHSPDSLPSSGVATLHALLRALFEPYGAGTTSRVEITGDDVPVDDKGATPVAMLVHELATNAAKYGALANDAGMIRLHTAVADGRLTMLWREEHGPSVAGAPEHSGFGTRLADMSVRQQMGGTLTYDWQPDGLQVTMVVKVDRLARAGA